MFCVKLFLFSKEPAQSTHMILLLQYAVLNLTSNMFIFSKEDILFLVVLVGLELDIANIVLIVVEVLCVLHSQMVSFFTNSQFLKIHPS